MLFGFTILSSSCRTTIATKPAAVVVKRPASPGVGFVWVDGGWYRSRGAWVQRPGYWVKPRPGRVYVTGHWVKTRKGYYWKNGHWK